VTGVRIVVAWLAGAERMPWRRFALWNALGGIAWAGSIGLLAYWIGSASSSVVAALGFVGGAGALAAATGYVVTRRRAHGHRREHGGSA
jgi:membrane protein DedA with SNARE-associated domain